MPIFDSVFELVGNTPMIRLPVRDRPCELYLKLEKFNPGLSIKDRPARHMIIKAEQAGRIRPGDTIIESSSGNTGTSLAMFAAARGYRFVCVVDSHTEQEKIDLMRAYGAIIERVGQDLPSDYPAAKERIAKVNELLDADPRAFNVNQYDNPDNAESHYLSTAEELMADLGTVSYLFVSVGTGGSISGTARRLKETSRPTVVVGVEPDGSILFGNPYKPFYQSGSGSSKIIYGNIDLSLIDHKLQATDVAAFNSCRYFAKRLGLLFGGSGGGLLYKTLQFLVDEEATGSAVALIPDGGEKYISTVFSDDWMEDNDLFDQTVEAALERWIDVPAMQARARATPSTPNSRL